MRHHLLTLEAMEPVGNAWSIKPRISLRSFGAGAPRLMAPMAGDEVELRLPDGRVLTAAIASVGVDVWKDSEGNFYLDSDPSDPLMTLTITGNQDIGTIPAGTEIWLSNARFAPTEEADQ